jgi:hypothetical protein
MDWLKNITDKIGTKTQQVKEGLSSIGQEISKKSERVYSAMFPLISPIPQERNAVKDIFDAIFSKDEEQTSTPVQEPIQPTVPGVVESTSTEVSTPSPVPIATPTPIIDITPDGTTRMYGRNPSIKKFKIEDRVYNAITKAANEFQIPSAILFDIALQESSMDPTKLNDDANAVDSNGNPLNPTGLFQFTDATWQDVVNMYNDKPGMSLHLPNTDRLDPLTNALAAAYLIKNGQLGKWTASKDVWGPYWSDKELIELGFYDQTLAYQ